MSITVENGSRSYRTDVKRFCVDARATSVCPKCGQAVTRDFTEQHLMYPTTNEPIKAWFSHDAGDDTHEWPESIVLRVFLEPAGVQP